MVDVPSWVRSADADRAASTLIRALGGAPSDWGTLVATEEVAVGVTSDVGKDVLVAVQMPDVALSLWRLRLSASGWFAGRSFVAQEEPASS